MDTLFYRREVEVMCMEDPICDLVIGNIPGAQEVKEPDPNWIPQLTRAAVTRA